MRGVRSAFKALKIASPQWWQRAQLVSNFAESPGVTDLFVSCSGPFEKLGTRTHVSGNCWVRLSWRKEGRPPSPSERTERSSPLSSGVAFSDRQGFAGLTTQCWAQKYASALGMQYPHGSDSLGSEPGDWWRGPCSAWLGGWPAPSPN